MLRVWLIGRTAAFALLLTIPFCLAAGCGDSGPGSTPGTVYSSPEEIKAKNQDLQDAMKGGAYGTAGKKSAGVN
jgi:hypothetical protein